MQKANKAPDTGLALFMEASGALSRWGEGAEHLLKRVLEHQAKSELREPLRSRGSA